MVYNAQEIFDALKDHSLVIEGCKNEIAFEDTQVQAASIDLRLDNRIVRFLPDLQEIDTKFITADSSYLADKMEEIYLEKDQPLVIKPHEIIFGQIYEVVALSQKMLGRIEGRSRTARLGLSVHCTASHINPGYAGIIPLQIENHNNFDIIIYPYMPICQIILYHLNSEPIIKYGTKNQYQNEKKAGPSVLSPVENIEANKVYNTLVQTIKEEYYEKHKTEKSQQNNTAIDQSVYENLKKTLKEKYSILSVYKSKLDESIADLEIESGMYSFISELEKCKILLLTANEVEDKMITQLFHRANGSQALLKNTIDGYRIQVGTICGIKAAHVVQHTMGSSSTSGSENSVNSMLKLFHPNLVVSIGVAYGIDPTTQAIGDVLISKKIIDIDMHHKLTNGKYKFYPDSVFSSDKQIHAAWEHFFQDKQYMKSYQWHYGTMFSKGTVLSDKEEKNRFLEAANDLGEDDIVGGEMEGAGVFRSCFNNSNSFACVVIKGICDWGEYKNALGDIAEELHIDNSNNDLKDWMQAYAAENAFLSLQLLLQKASSAIIKEKTRNRDHAFFSRIAVFLRKKATNKQKYNSLN